MKISCARKVSSEVQTKYKLITAKSAENFYNEACNVDHVSFFCFSEPVKNYSHENPWLYIVAL